MGIRGIDKWETRREIREKNKEKYEKKEGRKMKESTA